MSSRRHITRSSALPAIIVLLLQFLCGFANAQEITARTATPRKDYVIGEEMAFAIHVKYPDRYKAAWGEIELPAAVEVLDSVKDITPGGPQIGETIILKLIGLEPGHFQFPSVKLSFQGADDSFSIQTDTIGFNINLVDVDTTRDIVPIHEPLEVPYTFSEIAPYIAGAVAIIIAALLGIWYYRKQKQKKPVIKAPAVVIPPHRIALDKLKKLQGEKLPDKGQVKLYYTRLSNILREYLQDAYHIDALELTTAQIIDLCGEKVMSRESRDILNAILDDADLVKFAKFKPDTEDMQKAYELAVKFVEDFQKSIGYQKEENR